MCKLSSRFCSHLIISLLLTSAFLTTLFLSACRCRTDSGGATSSVNLPDLGKVLEKVESRITAANGVKISLPNGACFEVSGNAVDEDIDVSLIQSAAPDISVKSNLLSDVYYLTSQGRPQTNQNYSLTIPFDRSLLPAGARAASIRAYALIEEDILYPVNATVDIDNQTVTVINPEVMVTNQSPSFRMHKIAGTSSNGKTHLAGISPPGPDSVGYVLGRPNLDQMRWVNEEVGERGDIYNQSGHVFSIILKRPAPRSLAKSVSDTLQEAYQSYNKKFTRMNNTPPFAHLSPENRMKVYFGDYDDVNGEYIPWWSWNGYIQVDVELALANPEELRGTLFHELFHAVQDVYSNMYTGGIAALWWYEATAEWASLMARNMNFTEAVRHEVGTYKHFMSLPIQESKVPDSYAYSLLIYHVEQQRPGHTREVLNSWNTFSGALYKTIVDAGKLGSTYPDFVREVMINAIPNPGLWARGFLVEAEQETRRITRPDNIIGGGDQKLERFTNEKERYGDHSFVFTAPPLTTSFFTVSAANIKDSRKVSIELAQKGKPSNNAWLVTSGEVSGPQSPPFRLSESGTTVSGLGNNFGTLWVAVFNPDPNTAQEFQLTVKLEKAVTDAKQWRLEKVDFSALPGEPISWKDDYGSYTLTVTEQGNMITHKLDTIKQSKVTDSLIITVQHDIPSYLPAGEIIETTATWEMRAIGTPRYTAAAIEFRQGELSGTIKRISLEENPKGEMTFKWKTPGIGGSSSIQKFQLTLNLKSTSSNSGLVKWNFINP